MEFFPKKKKVDEKEVAAKAEAKLADYVKGKPGFKEEAAAQEGDISDYVMPFKGALKTGGKSAAKAGLAFIKSMGPPNKEKRPPKLTDYSKKDISERTINRDLVKKEQTSNQAKKNIKPIEGLQYGKDGPSIMKPKEKQLKKVGLDKDGNAIFEPET